MADSDDPAERGARSWTAVLRLWLVLFLSYATLKVIFNAVFLGWIDLRPAFFWEVALVPIGQSLIVWAVARGRERRAARSTPRAA